MKRNKLIIILLLVVFLFFTFRVGGKLIGVNINLGIMETQSSENIETPPEPKTQVLNEPQTGTGTGPTKVGTISINPGGVTTVEIEK